MTTTTKDQPETVAVTLTRELFVFETYRRWVNKARSWFYFCDVPEKRCVCIDAKGRICRIGADFMRADAEGAFPVRVFEI